MHEETAKRKNTCLCKNLYGDRRRNLYCSIHFCCLCRVAGMRNRGCFKSDMGRSLLCGSVIRRLAYKMGLERKDAVRCSLYRSAMQEKEHFL